jgi:hypothetical protein
MPTQDPTPAVDDSLTLAEDCAKARERAKGFCIWTKIPRQPLTPRDILLGINPKYRMGCSPGSIVPDTFASFGKFCPVCRKPVKLHEAQAFDSPPGMETKSAPTASPEQSG